LWTGSRFILLAENWESPILRNLLIAALVFVGLAGPALAHPHIFIDAKARILFDEAGNFVGIEQAWTFDEAFSIWQIQGLDTDGDGITSTAEMQELADENLVGLAEYSFYTFVGNAGETLPLVARGDVRFEHVEGRSTLYFGLEPEAPYPVRGDFEIAVSDPEYYVAITFADASTVTPVNMPAACALRIEPPREMSPELAAQLYALPPDVTQLPPELSLALRGVQGAIVIACPGGAAPATALEAANAVGQSQGAPFGGPPPEPSLNLPRTGFFGWIGDRQRDFYVAMNGALGALRTDFNAFWLLGGLSFLYGIFHAAGPGHGKVVISAYVLANERQVRRGVLLSFIAAFIQSLVAIAFVLVLAAVLQLSSSAMNVAADWIGIASYALVALLGLWLIARKLFFPHRHEDPLPPADTLAHAHVHGAESHDHGHHHHDHDHDHHHSGHAHMITPAEIRSDWREQAAVVFGVGLRPCSGALVVLVFALSQGLLAAGIAAVLLMGLGTAITVAVLASLAVAAKGLARRLAGARAGALTIVIWWVELAGAVAVFAFGVILLLASL